MLWQTEQNFKKSQRRISGTSVQGQMSSHRWTSARNDLQVEYSLANLKPSLKRHQGVASASALKSQSQKSRCYVPSLFKGQTGVVKRVVCPKYTSERGSSGVQYVRCILPSQSFFLHRTLRKGRGFEPGCQKWWARYFYEVATLLYYRIS